jgi:hypothetical protein
MLIRFREKELKGFGTFKKTYSIRRVSLSRSKRRFRFDVTVLIK